jgi:hypothetical protein
MLHALLSSNRQSVNPRTADEDGFGSEAESLDDIRTTSDARVEQDLKLGVRRDERIGGDACEGGEGRYGTVELAAAVVRDDDA